MISTADLIRAAHLAASVLPAGLYAFLLLIARPPARQSDSAGAAADELRVWTVSALRWCVAIAFVSGLLWLGVEAVTMSGAPLAAALMPSVVGAVLGSTLFGQLWLLRAGLLAALAAWVVRPAARQKTAGSEAVGLVLAGGFAVTLAWVGHAAGLEGADGAVLLASQIVHIAATSGWLGALLPLAVALSLARRQPGAIAFAAAVTRRFSPLGILCVAALVASGIVNSCLLVGTIPALLGTAYGHLLLIKLAMVLAMLALAAVNRQALTPAFGRDPRRALRALAWTISLETVLGLGVLVVVGALGASTPGAHEQPLWPFSFTLSMEPVLVDGRIDPPFMLTCIIAIFALPVAVTAALNRTWVIAGAAAVVTLVAADKMVDDTELPVTPTAYQSSPIAFTADAVARGGTLYAENCAVCHGATGRGDGPAAAAFPPEEATVVGHLLEHREGELFWWIGHGIAGTPMPGFAAQITPNQRWTLIQFLRAQAQATTAAAMNWHVSRTLGVPAPDFAFQIEDGPLETLADERGKAAVLLVLYSRPESDARLAQLAAAVGTLPGLRTIAVPLKGSDVPERLASGAGIFAQPQPEIVASYALYGWRIGGLGIAPGAPQGPRHTEFLIDRSGNLRARWHLGEGGSAGENGGWSDLARLRAELETLAREPFRPPEPEHHMHG